MKHRELLSTANALVKFARQGDKKHIREEEWHDYLFSPSDRAGEIEAALALQGKSTDGLSEWAATHPAAFSAITGLAGGLGAAGLSMAGGSKGNEALMAGAGTGVLSGLLGNAYATASQDDLVRDKVSAPTAAMKRKARESEEESPKTMAAAGGLINGVIPGVAEVTTPLARARYGRNAYHKRLRGDPLSLGERYPKTTTAAIGLPATLLGAALLHAAIGNK